MKILSYVLTVVAAVCLGVTGTAASVETYWMRSSGDWSTSSNWTRGEPGSGDTAVVNSGTANITKNGEVCRNLRLGVGRYKSGTVRMYSGKLSDYNVTLGWKRGTGTFYHSGGTHAVGSGLVIGFGSLITGCGSTGKYYLSGSGQLSSRSQVIGDNCGIGTFRQTGGNNTISGTLEVGHHTRRGATYELKGGSLSANNEYIGVSEGAGTFKHSGGNNNITNELRVGYERSSTGAYTLSGSGNLTCRKETVGYSGTGTFTQSGGTNTTSYLQIGYSSGGNGTYRLTGGTLRVNQYVWDSSSASGKLIYDGGTLDVARFIRVDDLTQRMN
jgi:hypothetical protein